MSKGISQSILDEQVEKYRNGEADPGVEVREDEDGVEYLFIPFEVPGYLAEIDSETYGHLFGFRAYDFEG